MIIQDLKAKAQELKTNLGVLYLAFKDKRTPWYAKALIGLVISYALSPIDLIPDFIPILGYLDDLILIPAGIALAIKLIPEDVMIECRQANRTLPGNKAMGTVAGIVIAMIWIFLIYLLVRYWVK